MPQLANQKQINKWNIQYHNTDDGQEKRKTMGKCKKTTVNTLQFQQELNNNSYTYTINYIQA